MNDYIQVRFDFEPCLDFECDILSSLLCDEGYESFVPDENGLTAFIKKELFNEDNINSVIASYPFSSKISHSIELVPGQDWNSVWEKNYFQPITYEDRCIIHSSFHKGVPKLEYNILIDPRMAFGTGHHETTGLMLKRILNTDMQGVSVLDMGTGTGILAILAAMRGASKVVGVEIDPPAYDNAVDNVKLNNHSEIEIRLGGAETVTEKEAFDFVFANINRNIILGDIDKYAAALKSGGSMFLSGFYLEDVHMLVEAANKYGLKKVSVIDQKNWANIHLVKE